MNDVLYVDAEKGTTTLGAAFPDDEGLNIVRISDYRTLARIYEWLKAHCRARDAGDTETLRKLEQRLGIEQETPRKYRTLVLDSLTEIQRYVMYQIKGVQIGAYSLDTEIAQADYKKWGQNSEMIHLLIRSFRDLPMNVIMVAPEQRIEDANKNLYRQPNLPGKLANEVQGFLDLVGYLAIVPVQTEDQDGKTKTTKVRRLFIQPGNLFQAKNRYGSDTVSYLDNPDMASLIKVLGIGG